MSNKIQKTKLKTHSSKLTANIGVFYLLTFSLFTGMGGYFVKLTSGINPVQILFFRALIASSFLFLVAIYQKKLSELKLKFPKGTFIMALTQGISIFLFYAALEKTGVTNAVLLTYMAPIFGIMLSYVFLKEDIRRKTIIGVVLSLIGVLLVTDIRNLAWGSDQLWGSFLALLGSFFYAAMAISSKSVTERTTPLYAAFWQYLIITLLALIPSWGINWQMFASNAVSLLYLGLPAGGIAFLLYMNGVGKVKGQIIQIVTMMEILVAGLSGVLLLGESLSTALVLGGLCIVGGVVVVSRQ